MSGNGYDVGFPAGAPPDDKCYCGGPEGACECPGCGWYKCVASNHPDACSCCEHGSGPCSLCDPNYEPTDAELEARAEAQADSAQRYREALAIKYPWSRP